MAEEARLQPPANEVTVNDDSRHTEAWAQYHQSVADRLARIFTGTITNDDAAAGQIGEYSQSLVAPAGVTLSNNIAADITHLDLTAGDWTVSGEVWVQVGASAASSIQAGIGLASVSMPGVGDGARNIQAFPHTATLTQVLPLAPHRFSIAVAATVYLVVIASFPAGTTTAYGIVSARRTR